MHIQDSISEMLSMQNALNEATNGADWRSGLTLAASGGGIIGQGFDG
ncbi:MAG: hypothetical protein IE937_01045 [Gammaproteobacteria bacterium]|nr:hypothetical protein [Gammaproteobacteria bacterium]